jgi:hypothetical protein
VYAVTPFICLEGLRKIVKTPVRKAGKSAFITGMLMVFLGPSW